MNTQQEKQLKKRNAELEKKLALKNLELEIETSLEKVRAIAMSMKAPADMRAVCKTISLQLQSLGVEEIRNIQTAIFYESRGTYINYEYYAKHNKTFITETIYTNHKQDKAFAAGMLKGKDEFFITHIKGKKVMEWIAFQKTTNVFIDRFLEKASSLNYYWYSLGQVALGISTYVPLTANELHLFKRFLKVFELAYRRFMDIELAVAQAKEARIETALERVRAVAMAMHKPDDLTDICEVLYNELHTLGFTDMRNSMINIHDDAKVSFLNYDYSDEIGKSINHLLYNIHPVIEKQLKQIRSANDAFSETVFEGDDLKAWKKFRKKVGEKNDPRINKTTALYYYFYSIGTGSIGISTFKPINDEHLELLKRFRNVFSLFYQRYNDISLAEAQAREATIEVSLERVRSRSMAMHKSDELLEAGGLLFNELTKLGIESITTGYVLMDNEEKTGWNYMGSPGGRILPKPILIPHNETEDLRKVVENWKKQEPFFIVEMDEQETIKHQTFIAERSINFPLTVKELMARSPKKLVLHNFYFKQGYILIVGGAKLTNEQVGIMLRFTRVFEMTYRRFLDLQKAEAQARESKIEAALERVRAQAMAMHKSEDLLSVCEVMYKELKALGFEEIRNAMIHTFNDKNEFLLDYDFSGIAGGKISKIPTKGIPIVEHYLKDIKKSTDAFLEIVFTGEELESWKDTRKATGQIEDPRLEAVNVLYYYYYSIGMGDIGISTFSPISKEKMQVLERFRKVFQLSYQRYHDIEKAEAQAKEAKVEAALERVRTAAMTMHSSEGLLQVTQILREQVALLGEKELESILIHIYNENADEFEAWYSYRHPDDPKGNIATGRNVIDWSETARARKDKEKYYAADTDYTIVADRTMLQEWYNHLFKIVPEVVELNDEGDIKVPDVLYYNYSKISCGALLLITNSEASEYAKDLLKRAATVFNLAYSRFLDLQKAEAQARESRIQLALERVRARTMAMQKSEELTEAAGLLFKQVNDLGIKIWTTGFKVWSDDNNSFTDYVTNPLGGFMEPYTIDSTQYPVFVELDKAKKRGEEFFVYYEEGEQLAETYRKLSNYGEKQFKAILESGFQFPSKQYEHHVFGTKVSLLFITYEPVPEAHDIFKRFGKVFEQTYTRFLDLQKAEAQGRDAQIQLALERIRGRSLAMHQSDELKDVVAILFQQLKNLGLEFDGGAAIHLFRQHSKDAVILVAAPNLALPIQVNLPYDEEAFVNNPIILDVWNAKETGENIFNRFYSFEEKNKYFQYVFKHNNFEILPQSTRDGILQEDSYTASFIVEKNSLLGANSWSRKVFSEIDFDIMKRIAKAFEQAFIRFLDLQKAEAQALRAGQDLIEIKSARKKAEDTVTELKATQAQLIQKEKMASLGELTAGIAHEIQNPLNFVNNFSEVNKELISELVEEVDKGNMEEIKAIANDIKENEEKINQHGKRADAIVKGMLQHSRSSTGVKEPTDINALCDEYLRLSYHGLRAKDKSFNADFTTDFDNSIGKINIVPQDIGRVLLNLINNAFYAVNERQKITKESYQPTVFFSTKKTGDRVIITITDNGNGIPQNIVDKIFQPFFTTKPTGQGTGLGLSLSYDIIKAHGGEIKVETEEGEGTKFIIQLPS